MDLEVQDTTQNPMPNKVTETEGSTELPNMSLDSKYIETEAPKDDMIAVDLKTQDTQLDPKQNPMLKKVIETEATTELPNMSLDSKFIETEAPKDDMMTVDLNTLDPKPNPMPRKIIETESPKNDMVTIDLNSQDTQLNSKPNPIPKKTMTPRHKFKRIKKNGKVQKIQSPGVLKMKFKPSRRTERVYWSKKLCHVNNLIHESNSFALHNLYHMVTPNISGLHTVIYPQNMWLLRRPRVKIK